MNEIVAWGKANYILGAGNDRSGGVDLEASAPWCVKVCEDRLDPFIKVQTVAKSTQSSGTILGEVINAFTLEQGTGNMAINCQTDEDAAKFARTRFMKRIKAIPGIASVLPLGRYDLGNNYIFFADGTFLIIQGPGENNAQSFTANTVWNDEPYLYPPGRIIEFSNRVGAVWNGKVLNTSVGGMVNSDIDKLYVEGLQWEWHHRCLNPACGKLFLPTWWKRRYGKYVITWDRSMEEGEATNYARLGETVRIVCPHCGERHPDTRQVRRNLTALDRAAYVAANPGGNQEKPSYRWNKISPWGYRLAELVEKWLKAMDAKRTGYMEPMQKFVTMDMAESYNRQDHEATGSEFTIPSADYELADVETEDFKRRFPIRLLAWDRQGGVLRRREGVCRAVGKEGSRLVWTGAVDDKRAARAKQLELGVPDRLTFQDCAFEPDEVYAESREFGWIAMYGSDREEWAHEPSGRHVVKTARPYSPYANERGAIRISWSNPRIKDAVLAKRTQQGAKDASGRAMMAYWGLPKDCPEAYLGQINQRKMLLASGAYEWTEGNDHRHDCECMIEAGLNMLLDGLYPRIAPGGKIPPQ
jgi:hypothetical protein